MSFGLPTFGMVGLPDASVRESRDRVRSAIRNSGFEFPPHRVTVNLGPADIRKAGSSFDLPIALGVLAATGIVARRDIDDVLLLGELSLDGAIQPARGVLPVAAAARRERCAGLLLPFRNAAEASVVEGLTLYPVRIPRPRGRGAQRPGSLHARARRDRRGRGRQSGTPGFRGRPRAGTRAPGAGDCSRGRTQRPDDRAARGRKDHDGAPGRRDPAATDVR